MNQLIAILEGLKPGVDYRTATDLVATRILDSLTIIALVAELEEAFDIEIPAVEITVANFDSAEDIWALVVRLQEENL